MKEKIVKIIYVILTLCCIYGMNSVNALAAEVVVSVEKFPDENFRDFVLETVDVDGNHILSKDEINRTKKLVIEWNQKGFPYIIKNYQGIECFTELEELQIYAVKWAYEEDMCDVGEDIFLNLSANTKLKKFVCEAGSVENLDLSLLPLLEEVTLHTLTDSKNEAVQDLSKHVNLKVVKVGQEVKLPEKLPRLEVLQLKNVWNPAIDFSASTELREVRFAGVTLLQLDLSKHSKLKTFINEGCHIATINLANCKTLQTIKVKGNFSKTMNMEGCSNLRILYYSGQFETLDVRQFKKLEYLNCWVDGLKKLDLRKNPKLKTVICQRSSLEKLLLSTKAKYKKISVAENLLSKLDLRKINVKIIDCRNNKIRNLKVKSNKFLQKLYCQNNKLKKLDLRKCKKLKVVRYSGNKLDKNKVIR